jgi:methyl-accepting chemotaxis protein
LKLTIGRKLILGFGMAILFIAIAGIAAYRSMQHLLEANYWVGHTFQVIAVAQDIRADLLQFESSRRGYIITGDASFLESSAGLTARLADSQKSIRWLTVDNPRQQSRLAVLGPLLDRRLADMTRISNIRKEQGFAVAVVAGRNASSESEAHTAQIVNLLGEVENEERELLKGREQTANAGAQNASRIILYGALIGVVLLACIAFATHRSITRPLRDLQQFVSSIGAGDLTQKSAREGSDELGVLAQSLNQVVSRLRTTTTQTRATTEDLNSAAVEILASAREQTAVTGQQVAAYQETNATMQQVSQSCVQMAEKAKEVTATAEAVSIASISGLDAVQKANQSVEAIHEQAEAVAQNIVSLSEKTQMVGDILATVNDIAEQSHLLALNAAIEAAAAGEHGRSFSVVASEIKNLADQSKSATVQVKTILGDIQKEINTSVMLTEEAVKRVDVGKQQADMAASAIRNMAANIGQSVAAFQQIVAGSNQQLMGFENVMQAMKDLSRGSEQATITTRQTEKAAANLTDLGMQLRAVTEGYRL